MNIEETATGTGPHSSREDGLQEGVPVYAVVDKSKKKNRAPGSSFNSHFFSGYYNYIIAKRSKARCVIYLSIIFNNVVCKCPSNLGMCSDITLE